MEGTSSISESASTALSETSCWKNLGRKMPREIKRLHSYNHPGVIEQQEKAAHFCFLVSELEDKYRKEEEMVPTTCREAWDYPNPYKCRKWREAISSLR